MTEFTSAYYVALRDQDDVEQILRRAGRGGFIFPRSGNWTCFVTDGEFEPTDEEVVAATDGVLVQYVFAEDHGWGFFVFEGGSPVFSLGHSHHEDDPTQIQGDIERAVAALSVGSRVTTDWVMGLSTMSTIEGANEFTSTLGLHPSEWLSGGFISRHREDFPTAREVL